MNAIIREVKEETGYDVTSLVYLGHSMTSSGFTNEKMHHFYVEVDGDKGELDLDHDENIEVKEYDFKRIDSLFKGGNITSSHAYVTYLKFLQRQTDRSLLAVV